MKDKSRRTLKILMSLNKKFIKEIKVTKNLRN